MAEEVIARISADISELKAEVNKASSLIQGFGRSVKDSAPKDAFGDLGKQLRSTFGPAAALGLATKGISEAVTTAASFESALRNVNSVAHMSEAELAAFGDQVRRLSAEVDVGIGPVESMRAAYDIMSAGFTNAADTSKVLASAMKGAAAGNTDAATAANVLAGALNAYGAGAEQAEHFMDVMFSTVKDGITTFPELAQSMGEVAKTAATFGVSFEELNAAIAILTQQGIKTPQAITAINQAILQLANPSKEAEKALDGMGVEADYLAQIIGRQGLGAALAELERLAAGDARKVADVAGSVDGLKAALALGGSSLDEFIGKMSDFETGAGNLDRAVQENTSTFEKAVERWKASVEELKIAAAEDGLPALTEGVDKLTKATRELSNVSGASALSSFVLPEGAQSGFSQFMRELTTMGKVMRESLAAGEGLGGAMERAAVAQAELSRAFGLSIHAGDRFREITASGGVEALKAAAANEALAKSNKDLAESSKAEETAAEDPKEAERKRKEALAERLHEIEVEKAAGRLKAADEITLLGMILAERQQLGLKTEEIRRLEVQHASAVVRATEEILEVEKRATEEKVANLERELAMRKAKGEATLQDEISIQQRIVAAHKAGTEERAEAEVRLAELKHKLLQKEEEDAKRAADLKAALEEQLLQESLKRVDDEIRALEAKAQKGEDVEAQIEDAMRRRMELQKRAIDLQTVEAQRRAEGLKDAEVAAKIEEVGRERKADVERDTQAELDRLHEREKDRAKEKVEKLGEVADAYKRVGEEARRASGFAEPGFGVQELARQMAEFFARKPGEPFLEDPVFGASSSPPSGGSSTGGSPPPASEPSPDVKPRPPGPSPVFGGVSTLDPETGTFTTRVTGDRAEASATFEIQQVGDRIVGAIRDLKLGLDKMVRDAGQQEIRVSVDRFGDRSLKEEAFARGRGNG